MTKQCRHGFEFLSCCNCMKDEIDRLRKTLEDIESMDLSAPRLKALAHAALTGIAHGYDWIDEPAVEPSGQQARFGVGDDVVITRWNAPAKVAGFLYKLEPPFEYPEDERDLSLPGEIAKAVSMAVDEVAAHRGLPSAQKSTADGLVPEDRLTPCDCNAVRTSDE